LVENASEIVLEDPMTAPNLHVEWMDATELAEHRRRMQVQSATRRTQQDAGLDRRPGTPKKSTERRASSGGVRLDMEFDQELERIPEGSSEGASEGAPPAQEVTREVMAGPIAGAVKQT